MPDFCEVGSPLWDANQISCDDQTGYAGCDGQNQIPTQQESQSWDGYEVFLHSYIYICIYVYI